MVPDGMSGGIGDEVVLHVVVMQICGEAHTHTHTHIQAPLVFSHVTF